MDNAQYYTDLMAKGATLANTDVNSLGDALSGAAATANSYGQNADSCWILAMLFSLFQRKAIHLTTLAVNVFSNTSIRKKQTSNVNSLKELQLSIFEHIEGYYNSKRPHSTLGMLTPNEEEALFWEQNS